MKIITIAILCILINQNGNSQNQINVDLEVVIDAELSKVYRVLKSMKAYNQWSPFLVEDPNQINYVQGADGKVGSIFYWEGVDEKSIGSQELKAIKKNEYVRLECNIQKPFKGQPVFQYHLLDSPNGVVVRQEFSIAMKGFSYIMARIFGAKKDIRKTNELGLARLKEYLETSKVTIVSINN